MNLFEKPPRLLFTAALAWFIVYLIIFSDAGVPFPTWLGMSAGLLVLAAVWLLRLGITFNFARMRRRNIIRTQLTCWVAIPALLAGGVLLANVRQTVLCARVYLSADALVHAVPTPSDDERWVGLFHVREFSRFDRELRFITNECGLVDTCGIIFSPDGPPPHRGEDSFSHLYGPWWHWYQSW
jgi:hypothetical protein